MSLADSCVWIEWFTDGPNAGKYAPLLNGDVVVTPLVLAEVSRWILRERGEDAMTRVQALLMSRVVEPMTAAVGNLAGELGHRRGLAMADAVIYAHAVTLGIPLVTQDEHFRGLPDVEWVPRASWKP